MKITRTFTSLAAATALVAGIGLAASTPASADGHLKTGGATTIMLDSAVAEALAAEDISLNVVDGGKASGLDLKFRVTGAGDGYIKHSGTLQFISGGTVVLEAMNPLIGWPTDVDTGKADITVRVPGFGKIPVFKVKKFTESEPEVKINLKDMTRKTTLHYSGNVRLTDNATIVAAINAALGVDVLVPDMKLGTLHSKVVLTVPCENATCTS